ncbi:CID domain-containing protein [Artemisia annua]|uniref:CID domain-containing protein n=1 Tax=Artemisia annua TaxID=35608 RepID=A0A2U1LSQ5_ARTAN|nr:CID domain-containing protein [Artemisia annua]
MWLVPPLVLVMQGHHRPQLMNMLWTREHHLIMEHGYSHRPYGMAVDIQRPRALIDACGAYERNTTTNQNIRHAKNSTINGLGGKVGGQTWQTTEKEEFEWEDMSSTLAGHGHAFGTSRSMPRKNDFTNVCSM